ncbi:hypothetical protein [Undibacterium sp. KW1]|uniref:hypothetical protein n=1 Tax=Undibacterium sp. KW1 TaxID=2058624 RepID=UPI0013896A55|nr:hypothetical protein [Undibacterium sp. KW1]
MKSKKIILAGALILLCAGGAMAYAWYPQYQGEKLVRNSLKDPDSAIFRDVKYVRSTKGVCGLVNAKNSMGGYVGFNDFYVEAGGKVAFAPPEDDARESLEDRLKSVQKRIDYLEVRVKVCPDEVKK